MGNVQVRFFQVLVSAGADGVPRVGGIAAPFEVGIPVSVAKAVLVNALATPVRGPARYVTLRSEARLLACLLTGTVSGPLHLNAAFKASARHIRGFVTECAGLGLLTAGAEEFFGWRSNSSLLHHFDALPTRLVRWYGTNRSRPDLLFNLGGAGLLAGEAKGRSRKRPVGVLAEQIRFMDKLLSWSHKNDGHPVVLSCAFLTDSGVAVDLFSPVSDFGSPVRDLIRRRGWTESVDRDIVRDPRYDEVIQQERRDQEKRDRRRRSREEEFVEDTESDFDTVERLREESPSLEDAVVAKYVDSRAMPTPEDLATAITERAVTIESQLYRDARQYLNSDDHRGTLLGHSVIGSWIPLDLFADTGNHLYFGLLEEEFTAGEVADLRRARRDPRGDGGIDVDITSRMVVVITRRGSASPPSWPEVTDAITRR